MPNNGCVKSLVEIVKIAMLSDKEFKKHPFYLHINRCGDCSHWYNQAKQFLWRWESEEHDAAQ